MSCSKDEIFRGCGGGFCRAVKVAVVVAGEGGVVSMSAAVGVCKRRRKNKKKGMVQSTVGKRITGKKRRGLGRCQQSATKAEAR